MKFLIIIIFALMISISSGCQLGVMEVQSITFESAPFLKDTIRLDNGNYCFLETPIITSDLIILMITNAEEKRGWINGYDKQSRKLLWTWDEAASTLGVPAKGFGKQSYIHDNVLCIVQNNLSYGIDIRDGSTIWKNRDEESSLSFVSGKSEDIVGVHIPDLNKLNYLKSANIHDGKWRKLFELKQTDSEMVRLFCPHVFDWNEKRYVSVVGAKWSNRPYNSDYWLYLYNMSEGRLEWKTDTIPLLKTTSGIPGNSPVFENGKILLANDAIYAFRVEDGSLEWQSEYGNSFAVTSNIKATEHMVYGNNESQFFVGLHMTTGDEVFKIKTGGTPSNIVCNNDLIYMASLTSNGQNQLHVINAIDGTNLHKINAPFREEKSEWIFDYGLAIDEETGLVYTSDHKNLLIYDFKSENK